MTFLATAFAASLFRTGANTFPNARRASVPSSAGEIMIVSFADGINPCLHEQSIHASRRNLSVFRMLLSTRAIIHIPFLAVPVILCLAILLLLILPSLGSWSRLHDFLPHFYTLKSGAHSTNFDGMVTLHTRISLSTKGPLTCRVMGNTLDIFKPRLSSSRGWNHCSTFWLATLES
jgi:hypothetical protein